MQVSSNYEIELVKLELLTPNPQNARRHAERQIGQIANSMKQVGYTNPVVIDERNMILSGEGRFRAAKKLGLTSIPCRRLIGLSEAEKRAFAISDNKIGLNSTWDTEILANDLKKLMELDIAPEMTGFDVSEVDALLAALDKADPKSEADKVDALPELTSTDKAVTRAGDIWQIGRHRMLCGSALDEAAVTSLMNGERAVMMFTDPPYNVPIDGFVSGRGKTKHREFVQGAGEMSSDGFVSFLESAFRVASVILMDGAIAYVCMDWRHLPEVLAAGHSVFDEYKQLCVWNKQNAGMGSFYRSQLELVLVWKNGTAPHRNNFGLGEKGRHRTNVWSYPGLNGFTKGRREQLELHSTVKPVAMVEDALRDVSDRGEIVLDLFGGSGTTLIAAEQTGRRARMVELDPLYCDVIVRRWEALTGKSATLAASGMTFEQVRRVRSGWGTPVVEAAHG